MWPARAKWKRHGPRAQTQRREIEGEVHDNYKTVDDAAHSAPSPSVELELARREVNELRDAVVNLTGECAKYKSLYLAAAEKQFALEGRAGLRATPRIKSST